MRRHCSGPDAPEGTRAREDGSTRASWRSSGGRASSPTPADEASRDLAWARDDALEDLQRYRHQLGTLLLRRGVHHPGRNRTQAHRRWVDNLPWAHAAERTVVEDYQVAIDHTEARMLALDARLAELAEQERYREPVGWLRCLRGIDTRSALLILAELQDFRRFHSARALMAFLGLVPGEASSGEKHRRGRITKMGHALVRRVLVEVSWHDQERPSVGRALLPRRTGPTAPGDRDGGQSPRALVSAPSTHAGGAQTSGQGGRRGRT